ncbi:retinaldehyde-binding protein 1-like [Brevipalpus obovatus]|uniref:retinaldehyde-binding protein 1-like n=1 Tax=Brevipalpus obovatus TaxID=246614 RepID=UPI003D9ECFDA
MLTQTFLSTDSNNNYLSHKSFKFIEESSVNQKFRQLINSDEKFGKIQFEDDFLQIFLRYGKNDPKIAYDRLKRYLSRSIQRPEAFTFSTKDMIAEAAKAGFIILSPSQESHHVIAVMRVSQWDPRKFPPEFIIQATLMCAMILERGQENGFHLVIDAGGFSLGQLLSIKIRDIMFLINTLFADVPADVHKFHVINMNKCARIMLKVIKPLLKARYSDSIEIIGNDFIETVKCCPISALPTYMGGSCEDIITEEEYISMVEKTRTSLEKAFGQLQEVRNLQG